jgi:hypothetical protein
MAVSGYKCRAGTVLCRVTGGPSDLIIRQDDNGWMRSRKTHNFEFVMIAHTMAIDRFRSAIALTPSTRLCMHSGIKIDQHDDRQSVKGSIKATQTGPGFTTFHTRLIPPIQLGTRRLAL